MRLGLARVYGYDVNGVYVCIIMMVFVTLYSFSILNYVQRTVPDYNIALLYNTNT